METTRPSRGRKVLPAVWGYHSSVVCSGEGEVEGFGQALERICAAAHLVDEQTITLRYLEALKGLGAGPATKFVIALEFVELATRISGYAERGLARAPGE